MAETNTIAATLRSEQGSRAARRLRSQGKIPAVMYGHKENPIMLSLDDAEVQALLRHGAHGLIDVKIDGKPESAVIKEMQWDVFGREIMHVDFARVSKDELVVVEVPVVLKGQAPGVTEGGVLDHVLHNIEIECPGGSITEQVVVNVKDLHLDGVIHVKDLELADKTRAVTDGELVVVQCVPPATEEELAGDAPAEPELIRKEKADEDSDD